MKAVIKGSQGNIKTLFKGSHEECIQWMRTHRGWDDLINLKEDGSYGRLSSWVL